MSIHNTSPAKISIHNTLLVVLWQILSLTVTDFFLVFSWHPSLMPCLLVFSIHGASPYWFFLTLLLWYILVRLNRPLSLWVPHSVHLHSILNVRITTMPSKLSHLTEKMANTSWSNPNDASMSVISRSKQYQILKKRGPLPKPLLALWLNLSVSRSPPPPSYLSALHCIRGNISSSSSEDLSLLPKTQWTRRSNTTCYRCNVEYPNYSGHSSSSRLLYEITIVVDVGTSGRWQVICLTRFTQYKKRSHPPPPAGGEAAFMPLLKLGIKIFPICLVQSDWHPRVIFSTPPNVGINAPG